MRYGCEIHLPVLYIVAIVSIGLWAPDLSFGLLILLSFKDVDFGWDLRGFGPLSPSHKEFVYPPYV